jgi:hypothetical protein
VSPDIELAADSTAVIMCGTTCPTWHDDDVERIMNQFITPTHPGQTIAPVAVTTPQEAWPLTGLLRLVGLAVGDPRIWGPGGAGWPNEPWWKLTGLFDLTTDQSIQAGVADLEAAMTAHGNDHLVIYGLSQGAAVANVAKKRLAAQYPAGTPAPDIDFVLEGDVNVPNGGFYARFPGLYIPILGWSFNGPEPTDTQFDTVVVNRQYDGFADFPLYPINAISLLNAALGIVFLHTRPFDISLPEDPTTSPAFQGTHGDSSYYLFPTDDLPLFAPLRMLGVPESLIDVVEPFFRVLVELGYDRSIPPWEPTPARLIPQLDPAKAATDLVAAIGEGIANALGIVGMSPPPSSPAPAAIAAAAPAQEAEDVGDVAQAATFADSGTESLPQPTTDDPVTGSTTDSSTMASAGPSNATPAASPDAETAAESSTDTTNGVSTSSSTPEPADLRDRPTPRTVVRDPLRVRPQHHDVTTRDDADQRATTVATGGDTEATAEAASSAGASSEGPSSEGSSSTSDS